MKSLPTTDSGRSVRSPKDGRNLSSTFLMTMADTTWRVFVPVALFVGIGIWADLSYTGTRPWLTLLGLVVGFVLAALLIRKQLQKVQG